MARSATSTTTPSTSSRRSWTSAGWRCPRSTRAWSSIPLSGVSMRYTFDAKPDAPTQKKRQYLRHARHPRDVGGRLEGRRRPRPVHRQGPFRQGPVAALPRRCGPLGIDRPGEAVSREAPGADQGVVRGRRRRTWCCRSTTAPPWRSSHVERPSEEAPRDRYVYYPGHGAGAGRRCRQRARSLVQDPRQCRDHRCECSAA